MFTLTLMDRDDSGCLLVNLSNILDVLGESASGSTWRVAAVEATGPGAEALYDAADNQRELRNEELVALAREIHQVIDGEFRARESDASLPWLIVRAVDSSSWDISTNRQDILDRFRAAFLSVYEAGEVGYE